MTIHHIGDHYTTPPPAGDPVTPPPTPGDPEPRTQTPIERFMWERIIRQSGLPPLTKLVAFVMATYGEKDGSKIHPGDQRLAADCGVTDRAIRNHRRTLEDRGYITRTHGHGDGKAAEYQLTFPSDFYHQPGSRNPSGGPPILI